MRPKVWSDEWYADLEARCAAMRERQRSLRAAEATNNVLRGHITRLTAERDELRGLVHRLEHQLRIRR